MRKEYKRILHPAVGEEVIVSWVPDFAGMSGVLRIVGLEFVDKKDERELDLNQKWNMRTVRELHAMYWRWSGNHMQPGTPAQMQAMYYWLLDGNKHSFSAFVRHLRDIGLYYDGDYRYGTEWKKEEVPMDVLEWLFTLPGKGHSFLDFATVDSVVEEEVDISDDALCAILCL